MLNVLEEFCYYSLFDETLDIRTACYVEKKKCKVGGKQKRCSAVLKSVVIMKLRISSLNCLGLGVLLILNVFEIGICWELRMSISFIAFDCLEFDSNFFSGSGCYIISEGFLSKINCLNVKKTFP